MFKKHFLCLGMLLLTGATLHARTSRHFKINSEKSTFTVHVKRAGLLKVFGHDHNIAIRSFSGEVTLADSALTPASLAMSIPADSLFLLDDVGEGDRKSIVKTMREEVLETASFPQIKFKSTSVTVEKARSDGYKVEITGDLELHGVTKNIKFSARMILQDRFLKASGGFKLKQKDYGMKPVSAVAGTVKVKNELEFSFSIIAE